MFSRKLVKILLFAYCGVVMFLLSSSTALAQAITKTDPPTVNTPSTVGRIPKWWGVRNNGIGIIGDSVITESGGNIGIDTINPSSKLTVGGTLSATGSINTDTEYKINGDRVLGTSGTANTFVGKNAGLSNIPGFGFPGPGTFNSFFGSSAGRNNTVGFNNSFFGTNAGLANSDGGGNSFFGANAGELNSTGGAAAFFGVSAGQNNTDGRQNSFFGALSGFYNTTGQNNSFFGYLAGQSNTTESNNTFIGAESNGAAGVTNATAIGANAVVMQSNSVVLGNNANVGIGTSAPQAKLHVIGTTAGRFDGNVNIDGNLSVTGAANLTASNAIHANAADTAIAFTGPVAGDVTGTQNATVVSSVGGKSATNVATATDAFNAATSSNTPGSHIVRDGSGNFAAGTITASLNGNAATATTADSANALTGTAVVSGSQIDGALTNATIAGSAVTGNIDASQISGNLTNATISGYVAKTGDTMTGTLNLPTNGLVAGTNQLVLNGGNVGIGTANPVFKLDVAGSMRSNSIDLAAGTINSVSGSLRLQGTTTQQGTTGGFLDLAPGNFYYPGGAVTLGAGTNSPQYGSGQGSYIKLFGNDYHYGGDILIASGHSYGSINGQGTGGTITLATSTAYGGNHPPPGPIVFKIGPNERFRVAGDGNIGVGTSTPGAPFEVNGGGVGPIFKAVNTNNNLAGQFDGNVTINGNLTVTGSTNLATTVNHDGTLTGNGTASSPLSVLSAPNGVVTTDSYANPAWITSLDGNKITAGTAVKSINGITDNVTLAAGSNVTITPAGNTMTISAAVTQPALNPQQIALKRWYSANLSDASVPVGGSPQLMAFDGSSIWVSNAGDNTVSKIRTADGDLLGTFSVGSNPRSVEFDGTNIWVANFGSNTVTRLRASDGQSLDPIPVANNPWGLAFDGKHMWVSCYGSGVVYKLDARSGQVLGTVAASNPLGLAFDGTNIWAVNNLGGGQVTKIAGTGMPTVLGVSNTNDGFPFHVTFDGTHIWVNNSGGSLSKFRISDGANLGLFGLNARAGGGMTFDGTNLWISGEFSLVKFRTSDNTLQVFPLPYLAGGAVFDGANIWVANSNGTVTKH